MLRFRSDGILHQGAVDPEKVRPIGRIICATHIFIQRLDRNDPCRQVVPGRRCSCAHPWFGKRSDWRPPRKCRKFVVVLRGDVRGHAGTSAGRVYRIARRHHHHLHRGTVAAGGNASTHDHSYRIYLAGPANYQQDTGAGSHRLRVKLRSFAGHRRSWLPPDPHRRNGRIRSARLAIVMHYGTAEGIPGERLRGASRLRQ